MGKTMLEHAGVRYQVLTSADNDSTTWIELQRVAADGALQWSHRASARSSAYMPCGNYSGPIFDDAAGTVMIEASSEGGRDGEDRCEQSLVIRIVDGVLV